LRLVTHDEGGDLIRVAQTLWWCFTDSDVEMKIGWPVGEPTEIVVVCKNQ